MDDPAQQDEAFHTILQINGLLQSRDFKFALTCAEEAAEACPEAPGHCAATWTALSFTEVEVNPAWELWTKFRCSQPAQR
eukprot:2127545-Heterocapsa_arctica.AAC.1